MGGDSLHSCKGSFLGWRIGVPSELHESKAANEHPIKLEHMEEEGLTPFGPQDDLQVLFEG